MAGRRRISWFNGLAQILRGVYPFDRLRAGSERLDLSSSTDLAEGLRMTMWSFRMYIILARASRSSLMLEHS